MLTVRRAGVCQSLCLCLLNVLSQQSDPGFVGSDLRGGRGPPSFHSHTDGPFRPWTPPSSLLPQGPGLCSSRQNVLTPSPRVAGSSLLLKHQVKISTSSKSVSLTSLHPQTPNLSFSFPLTPTAVQNYHAYSQVCSLVLCLPEQNILARKQKQAWPPSHHVHPVHGLRTSLG